ncbi:Protein of uncharacterised function (DUF2797) [Pseudomonas aeruginosa]|nr:Protein of uncharacterised function (DUF2797) [Pseudomonas aeruginosa]
MLKGEAEPVDLAAVREQLFDQCADGLRELQQRFGLQAIQPVIDLDPLEIAYPVEAYPSKVASLDLEKTPIVEGTLRGIKGQYLILDTGVINIRKIHGLPDRRASLSRRATSHAHRATESHPPQGLSGAGLPDRRDPPEVRTVRRPQPGTRRAEAAAQPRARRRPAAAVAAWPATGAAGARTGRPGARRGRLPAGRRAARGATAAGRIRPQEHGAYPSGEQHRAGRPVQVRQDVLHPVRGRGFPQDHLLPRPSPT